MRLALLAATACSLAVTSVSIAASAAEQGPYLSFAAVWLRISDTDADQLSITYDTGFAVQGAGGYRFNEWFRAELELGYGRADVRRLEGPDITLDFEGEGEAFAAAVNGFIDWPLDGTVQPYVGAGIGIAHTRLNDPAILSPRGRIELEDDRSTNLLLQGEVGLSVAITERFAFVPSWRYLRIANGNNGVDDTKAHLFRAGLRYSF
ncbi:porin family protein [Geminicoccaceae bacterium 1502E]|nr:porin family protein [Geminicoccaceae bacterium 1502E]